MSKGDNPPAAGVSAHPVALNVHCPAGVLRIDPDAREVWRGNDLVVLPPQVFDCIAYLLAHRERAVGRDELIAAVWGRVDITDTVLHQTVMKARRAFGDSGEEQQVLRTVPRFGYRWIAAVDDAPAADAVRFADASAPDLALSPDATTNPRPQPARAARAFGWFAALLVLGALVIAGLWWLRHAPEPQPDAGSVAAAPALAVLPVVVAPGAETAWISLGVMDAIGSYLREGGEAVVPSQTVIGLLDAAGGGKIALAQWRSATGATRIVRSTATRHDNAWQMELTLEDGNGVRGRVQGEATDVLAAARLASRQLLAVLQRPPSAGPPVADPDAAISLLLQRVRADLLANHLDDARSLLDSAAADVLVDPRVRLERAEVDYRGGQLDAAGVAYAKLLDELPAESQPRLRAQALIALASIERTRAHFETAEHGYAEAIALLDRLDQPTLAGRAHLARGAALGSLRRFDEAQREIARGRVLLAAAADAHGVASADAALATLDADRGRLAAAAPALERALAQLERLGADAEAFDLRIALAQMYTELLQHDRALEQSERTWRSTADTAGRRLHVMAGAVYARALGDVGRVAEAQRIADDVVDGSDADDYRMRYAHNVAAELALRAGHAERAERLAAGALVGNSMTVNADIGPLLLAWMRALRTQGKSVQAATAYARIGDWSARWHDDHSDARVFAPLIRAEQEWAERRLPESYRDYAEALSRADELGVPLDIAMVANSYGNALLTDGALDEAAAVVGQVAAWADGDFNCAVLTARLHQALGHRDAWGKALAHARALAGERRVPDAIANFSGPEPSDQGWLKAR